AVNGDDFRAIALALDGVAEMSHAKHPDFRAHGRVFASLLSNEQRAGLKLLPDEQREFVRRYPAMFSPAAVPGDARDGPWWIWLRRSRPSCEVPCCWRTSRSALRRHGVDRAGKQVLHAASAAASERRQAPLPN